MKPLARIRTSGALWLTPLCLAITLLYFFKSLHSDPGYTELLDGPEWAPSLIARALDPYYAFAYAVAAALGAWEAGRLKKDQVWALAPSRSRYRVAAESLLPGIVMAWSMLLLPVVMALVEAGAWLTFNSLPLVGMGLFLVCAHTVIGFTAGLWVHRVISAPLLAAGVLYLVGWSASDGERLWPQHISGQYTGGLMFGELIPFTSLWPHLLFTGSVAAACSLAWAPLPTVRARITLRAGACAAVLVSMAVCISHVHSWGAVSPLATNKAPLDCVSGHPRVCVPQAAHADVPALQREIIRTFTALQDAGVTVHLPQSVNDSLAAGRPLPPSADRTWWLPLTKVAHLETVRLQIVLRAVTFPCRRTDEVNSRSATLWAATTAGAGQRYLAWQQQELDQFQNRDEVLAVMKRRVSEAAKLLKDQQAAWYERELTKACTNAGKDIRP
ncbi:hypothetical protein ABZ543_21825 [Streptomyces roseifaciens]